MTQRAKLGMIEGRGTDTRHVSAPMLRLAGLAGDEAEARLTMTLDSDLTSGPSLAKLASHELDSLLADLEKPAVPATVAVPAVPDHDYAEDWGVLGEFLQDTAGIPDAPPDLAADLTPEPFHEASRDLRPLLLATIQLPLPDDDALHLLPTAPVDEQVEDAPVQVAYSPEEADVPVDSRYKERRRKNNAASRASRATRKEKRVALEAERAGLEKANADLSAEIARLEAATQEWKAKLLQLIG